MKISARNQLKGTVLDIQKGATTAHVRVRIGSGDIVTAAITNAAIDDLALKPGSPVVALIKASDVLIGVD